VTPLPGYPVGNEGCRTLRSAAGVWGLSFAELQALWRPGRRFVTGPTAMVRKASPVESGVGLTAARMADANVKRSSCRRPLVAPRACPVLGLSRCDKPPAPSPRRDRRAPPGGRFRGPRVTQARARLPRSRPRRRAFRLAGQEANCAPSANASERVLTASPCRCFGFSRTRDRQPRRRGAATASGGPCSAARTNSRSLVSRTRLLAFGWLRRVRRPCALVAAPIALEVDGVSLANHQQDLISSMPVAWTTRSREYRLCEPASPSWGVLGAAAMSTRGLSGLLRA
jgi:hypothetical protein